jgi:sugar phosphate isomerase/epimerase
VVLQGPGGVNRVPGGRSLLLSRPVTALSTSCRGPAAPPASFVARARAVGAGAIVLDATLDAEALDAFSAEALRAGLTVAALEAPCPRPRVPRPPRLASGDREERLAAGRQTGESLRRARDLGARILVVALGELPGHDPAPVLRAFARRELEEGAVRRLVEGRRARSQQALDWARFGLELVLDEAVTTGVTLALVNRPLWFEIPSAGEANALLDELAGAPLATFFDPAAAYLRRVLGLGAGRPAIELGRAAGAWLTDAAGARGGLPWGTGEASAAGLGDLPDGALRAVHCLPLATDEELAAALR